jgi:hypothetical protein
MDALATATILAALVLLASMASVELGLSVAIIEIALGVFAGNTRPHEHAVDRLPCGLCWDPAYVPRGR